MKFLQRQVKYFYQMRIEEKDRIVVIEKDGTVRVL
jgi:hypothetical protein